jgi:DNA-binding winged helix-turn-helix (wHTH) protein
MEKLSSQIERDLLAAENAFWHSCDLGLVEQLALRVMASSQSVKDSGAYLRGCEILMRVFAERDNIAEIQTLKLKLLDLILTQDVRPSPRLYHVLGVCSSYSEQFSQAGEYFRKSIAEAQNLKSVNDEVRGMLGLINVLRRFRQYEEALIVLTDAQLRLANVTDQKLRQHLPLVTSRFYREYGNLDLALSALEQFYEISGGQHYLYFHMRAMYERAECDRALGKIDSARTHFEILLRLTKKTEFHAFREGVENGLRGLDDDTEHLDLDFDVKTKTIRERSKGVVSFANQFILVELMLLLARNQGQVLSKEEIVRQIWGENYNPLVHDNKLYVTIRRLRELIEPQAASKPQYIFRAKNGYYLNQQTRIRIQHEDGKTNTQ